MDHAPVPLPVVFFAHAVGGSITDSLDDAEHYYDHIFDRLNEDGFVVVATTVGGQWEDKQAALQCAVEWAYTQWPEQDHLGCDVVFMGHSAGGGAAQAMVSFAQQSYTDLDVGAAVGIAPVATSGPTLVDAAVPYLLLQDPADDDASTHAGIVYDGIVPEDPPEDPPVFPPADKVLLWPFGTEDHYAWGGTPFEVPDPLMDPCDDLGQTMAVARTRALASSYISAFLRWQIYGETEQRRWFVDPTHYAAGASAFLPEIAGGGVLQDYWCTLYEDGRFDELGERPVMLAAFAQGADALLDHRLRVDTMWREGSPGTCGDPGHETALAEGFVIQNSEDPGEDHLVATEPLGAFVSDSVCIGQEVWSQDMLGALIGNADTYRLHLEWADPSASDGVEWNLGQRDLASYSVMSLRVGRDNGVSTEPMSVRVAFESECSEAPADCEGSGDISLAQLDYDRLIHGGGRRRLRHTVRFPLADLCVQGIDIQQMRALRILGTGDDQPANAAISLDALELTGHPEDAALGCSAAMVWRCEATSALEASESSCGNVPVSGVCDSLDEVSTPIDLPSVDEGQGFDGWRVWVPPGWIVDAQDPTPEELEAVTARCVTACEQEYAGSPHLSANCDAPGAFETPVPSMLQGLGTRQAIPDAYRDGTGLFENESLSCNLLHSCCEAFDEDVCPAAPRRVTAADSQLGRGETFIDTIAGTLTVESLDDETEPAEVDISGTVGWSPCAAGNATGPCPFYLGSAHLETDDPVTLELSCDGEIVERQLDALVVDLMQPALGINQEDEDWVGFPPGALLMRTSVELGMLSFEHIETNREPMYAQAEDAWLRATPPGGFIVYFDIWCDGDIKLLKAYFEFDAVAAPHGPPTVEIDMPGTVTCSSAVALEALAADLRGTTYPRGGRWTASFFRRVSRRSRSIPATRSARWFATSAVPRRPTSTRSPVRREGAVPGATPRERAVRVARGRDLRETQGREGRPLQPRAGPERRCDRTARVPGASRIFFDHFGRLPATTGR